MLTRKILSSTAAIAMTASIALLAGCPTPGGTPTPTDESVAPSATATPAATATPVATATATPVATATAVVSNQSASPTPQTPTGSSNPVGQTGGTSDIKERATFNGKVYDPNGIVVEGASVNAKSVDANVSWVGESQISTNGAFVFRNAPVGARVEITVTKDGWTTRVRTEVLKSNLQGDPTANVFDFGGLGANGNDQTSSFYAIQDEPEITSLKINGQQATNSGGFPINAGGADCAGGAAVAGANNGRFGIANLIPCDDDELKASIRNGQPLAVSLSGVANDRLDVEMVFSEPVDRESVQNNFKVLSQAFDVRQDGSGFEIDENLSSLTFTWAADDKSVLVKTNKPILTTTTTPEARYLLKWTNPFKDKTEKNALKVGQGNISPTGHFRYNPGTNNDFNVFGVKIDDEDPRMLSIQALDGGSANDVLRLTFNEPLEVVNQSSIAFGLGDPGDEVSSADRQLWAYNTDNNQDSDGDPDAAIGDCDFTGDGDCGDAFDNNADGDTTDAGEATFEADAAQASVDDWENEATVVGYLEDTDDDNVVEDPDCCGSDDKFQGVYMIARLPQNITRANQVHTSSLAGAILNTANNTFNDDQLIDGNTVECTPSRGNPDEPQVGNQSLLRFAKIDGNVVTMEFAPEAFNRNEKLIVSIGEDIDSSYQDTSRSVARTDVNVDNNTCDGNDPQNPEYSNLLIDPAGNDMSNSNSTNSGNLQVDDSLRVATAS
jgi:hypothetical protein